jgi:hypothetical protein
MSAGMYLERKRIIYVPFFQLNARLVLDFLLFITRVRPEGNFAIFPPLAAITPVYHPEYSSSSVQFTAAVCCFHNTECGTYTLANFNFMLDNTPCLFSVYFPF